MKRSVPPVSIAGSQLDDLRHVCAFFNSDDEEYGVLMPFIEDGFRRGHKAVHVVNPDQRARHLARLRAAAIDVENASRTGQLDLRLNTETYLQDGTFDQDRMLQSFEQIANSTTSGPFPLSRIVCRMDWASAEHSQMLELLEFESRVNEVWQRHDDVVVCTYHLSKFGGEAVVDIMRTHPMIIIGGMIQQNPFYVPPEVFLKEFRERRERRNKPAASEA